MSIRSIAASLLSIEGLIVGLAVGVGAVLPGWLPLSIGVALAFWPLRWWLTGRMSVRTPADLSIVLLVLMIPVTLWATALQERTSIQVLRLAAGIGLFYSLANWASANLGRLRLLVLGLGLVLLLLVAIAPFGVEWLNTKYPIIPTRVYDRLPLLLSDPANPNVFAGFMVTILPVVSATLLFSWRNLAWYQRLVGSLAVGLSFVVLVLTQSRGAWVALAVAAAVLVILRWRRGWVLLAGLAAIVLLLVIFSGSQEMSAALASEGRLGSLEGRLEVWSRALYMIQDFPLTGVGMGTYMEVTDLLYPLFRFNPGVIEHAHNLFLQVAVDLGIPGAVAWISILVVVVVTSWRLYRLGLKPENRWVAGLGAGLVCSQIALVTHGLVDAVTWGMVRPAPLVWGVWGLAAAGAGLILGASSDDQPSPMTLIDRSQE